MIASRGLRAADLLDEGDETTDAANPDVDHAKSAPRQERRTAKTWTAVLCWAFLPAAAMILGAACGYLKWQDTSMRVAESASIESVQAATATTVKLLSYRPDTVDRDLGAARDDMTGDFRDSYTQLTRDVVIPGAKQKQISSVATVPAVASVSASANHAAVLVFVNQSVIVGADPPTSTASTIRVTMVKPADRWLISAFDPI